MTTITNVHAVLQAGGLGSRIRPAAQGLPKPLLQVSGLSMAERLLRQLVASGIRRVTVVVGKHGAPLEDQLNVAQRDLPADLHIDFHRERSPLGNAGALSQLSLEGRTVLLVFADLVTDMDFLRLINVHRTRSCDITLASHYEETRLSLGELRVAEETVVEYLEKPKKRYLICSGVALFEPRVFELTQHIRIPFGLVDVVNAALASGCKVTHWAHGAYWIDVNTPELLEQVRADLEEGALADPCRPATAPSIGAEQGNP